MNLNVEFWIYLFLLIQFNNNIWQFSYRQYLFQYQMKRSLMFVLIISLFINLLFSLSTVDKSQHDELNSKVQSQQTDLLQYQTPRIIQLYNILNISLRLNTSFIYKAHNQKQEFNEQDQNKLSLAVSLVKDFYLKIDQKVGSCEQQLKLSFSNNQIQIIDLGQHKINTLSWIYSLQFLGKFKYQQLAGIELLLKTKQFSVIEVTLLNHNIKSQITLCSQQKHSLIPVWIPKSLLTQSGIIKKQQIKYYYFRLDCHSTKLRIDRIKGHPKIYLYNCQTNQIGMCIEEIQQNHIQGTLMFQKQMHIQIQKQKHCKDCVVILAFKNMAVQTYLQIKVLAKGKPYRRQLKQNQQINVISYFTPYAFVLNQPLYLDVSFNQGYANDTIINFNNIQNINQKTDSMLAQDNFKFIRQDKFIRIILGPNFTLSSKKQQDHKFQIWFKISLKITVKSNTILSIVDQNQIISDRKQAILNLNDGQIFNTQIYKNPQISSFISQYRFKVNIQHFSTLRISSQCQNFNSLHLLVEIIKTKPSKSLKQKAQKSLKQKAQRSQKQISQEKQLVMKIAPKILIPHKNLVNNSCSQLIHLNPSIFNTTQNQVTLLFNIQGIYQPISLLFSKVDIVQLDKQYYYHSDLRYQETNHFYINYLQNTAIIKIQKCSDCQITISYSEEQLVDLKGPRKHQIHTKNVQNLQNQYIYQLKYRNGIFIKIQTNNFAHYVLTVNEKILQNEEVSTNPLQNVNSLLARQIKYSLVNDQNLDLTFNPPTFLNLSDKPIVYTLIEGSIRNQVTQQTYCPHFIFSQKQRTRDISIQQIKPTQQITQKSQLLLKFNLVLKHHDFFGVRAQKANQVFIYQVVNIQMMKQFGQYRWSIYNLVLFFTMALLFAFVCFMNLKKRKIRKFGGQIIYTDDQENQAMTS